MENRINKLDIDNISGKTKEGKSILRPLNEKYVLPLARYVPKWIKSYHLTLMSIIFSVLIILGAFLYSINKQFVFITIFSNIGQYISDTFDGEVGRLRDTGLVFWGFLVDHFLDYFFASSNIIALYLIADINIIFIFIGLLVVGGSFLLELHKCNLFGKYSIHGTNGIGGIELRLITVLYFTLTIFLPLIYIRYIFYVILFFMTYQMIHQFYTLQKQVWKIDMDNKKQRD